MDNAVPSLGKPRREVKSDSTQHAWDVGVKAEMEMDRLRETLSACTRNEFTGFTPYELMFGWSPRFPVDLALMSKANHSFYNKSNWLG